MKEIKVIILVLSVIILSACGTEKKSITGEEFKNTLTNLNYTVKNSLDDYDYAIAAYNASKNGVNVFFLKGKQKYDVEGIFIDEYQNLFNSIEGNYSKKLTNGKSWTSLKLKTSDKGYYLSWVQDTYIVINYDLDHENDVNKLIESIGY